MSDSLKKSLRPLLWLNNFYGFMVFETPNGRSWPKLSFFYSTIKFFPYGFALWYGLIKIPQKQSIISIVFVVFKVVILVNAVTLAIPTIFSFSYYNSITKFIKKVTSVDETLKNFGIDPEHRAAFREHMLIVAQWCLGTTVLFILTVTMYYYIFDEDFHDAFIFVFTVWYPMLANPLIDLNFLITVQIAGKRFERLNALIQSISISPLQIINSRQLDKYLYILNKNRNKVEVKSNYYSQNRNNIGLILKTARQLHLELCKTSREINEAFSKQMSLQIAATFIILTGFSYCIYIVYEDRNVPFIKKFMHYKVFGLWIIASILRTICVARVSTEVSLEADRTSHIAHEIQLSKWQKHFNDEIHQLSLQIMQHPLYFTACDMIVLDFNYIRGFVGSVTTYLMILITNQQDVLKAARALAKNFNVNNTRSND